MPEQFENATHAKEWLPLGWHPAVFDLDAARIAVHDVFEVVDG